MLASTSKVNINLVPSPWGPGQGPAAHHPAAVVLDTQFLPIVTSALAPEAWSLSTGTLHDFFSNMSNPYAFEFSDGGKKYTLVCTVESPGVQPRFTLALTDGASSWTSDSELHKGFESLKQCTCALMAFCSCV